MPRLSKIASRVTHKTLLFLFGCVLSCDRPATAPLAPKGPTPLGSVHVSCAMDGSGTRATCTPSVVQSTSTSGKSGARGDVVLPPESVQLILTFGDDVFNPTTRVLSISIAVRNVTDHAIGTADGSTVSGVKLFYTISPHVTAGSGSVSVVNADGVGTFSGPDQPFYSYPQIIPAHGESAPKLWQWQLSGDVQGWQFDLGVAADVSGTPELVASGDVGTGGGTISDGNAQVSLTVPAGALARTEHLTITRVPSPGGNDFGAVFDIEPTGVAFGAPALLKIRLDPEVLPLVLRAPNASLALLAVATREGNSGPWTLVPSEQYDIVAGQLTVRIDHLSQWGIISVDWAQVDGMQLIPGQLFCAETLVREQRTRTGNIVPNCTIPLGQYQDTIHVAVNETLQTLTVVSFFADRSPYYFLGGQLPACSTPLLDRPHFCVSNIFAASQNVLTASIDQSGRLTGRSAGQTALTPNVVGSPPSLVIVTGAFVSPVPIGTRHSCTLDPNGFAHCWGANAFGQLGDGTTQNRVVPTDAGGGIRYRLIVTDNAETCGIARTGETYCWGDDQSGALGSGTLVTTTCTDASIGQTRRCATRPQLVAGGLAFIALAVGGSQACGLTAAGAAYCWGDNDRNGTGAPVPGVTLAPQPVAGGHIFSSITAGSFATCAVTPTGDGYCWGRGYSGMLGNGTLAPQALPTQIAGGHKWKVLVATGFTSTCGLDVSGRAFCWGANGAAELGNGIGADETSHPIPEAVSTSLTFESLTEGYPESCGVTAGGAAYCWGSGPLGTSASLSQCHNSFGFFPCAPIPVPVSGNISFRLLAGGFFHGCGQAVTGTVYCWGANDLGDLGNGAAPFGSSVPTPANVPPGSTLFSILATSLSPQQ